jgi:cytochrome c-type biogenesis protein CcsB
MIFSGSYLKVLPIPNDANNTWISPQDLQRNPSIGLNNPFAQSFYSSYITALRTGLNTGNWNDANQLVDNLEQYQIANGSAVLPSKAKVSSEILLNDLSVFSRLSKSYGLLGLAFLTLVFMAVFKPQTNLHLYLKIFYIALWVAFAFHTIGLGLRWYVSGRAPWSNGYESMIYIAWTTTLAGLIFSRKSSGVLAATNVLSATILMVAGLSWLDPEITPLVPVLKSYWLTIHVSLEAGSYGFLMLGAIIGLLNLILISFANKNNGERIFKKVKEMTYISEMTLIGGLFMVSIGTYLGGVWANESWGRYWGWDAKETWALVTILVYAFILHMRFIPGLKSLYAFNVASLFGWATVLMTYFGVNYYLSGLHSYAAGDPVPIPDFVYYAVILLTFISLFAFWRYKICRKELQKVNFTTL